MIDIQVSLPEEKEKLLNDFIEFAIKEIGIKNPPTVTVQADRDGLETTAVYNPNSKEVKVSGKGRAIVDIMRSVGHELCHHYQNETGKLQAVLKKYGKIENIGGSNKDDDIEDEANAIAGQLIKKFAKQHSNLIYEQFTNTDIIEVLEQFKDYILNKRTFQCGEYTIEIDDMAISEYGHEVYGGFRIYVYTSFSCDDEHISKYDFIANDISEKLHSLCQMFIEGLPSIKSFKVNIIPVNMDWEIKNKTNDFLDFRDWVKSFNDEKIIVEQNANSNVSAFKQYCVGKKFKYENLEATIEDIIVTKRTYTLNSYRLFIYAYYKCTDGKKHYEYYLKPLENNIEKFLEEYAPYFLDCDKWLGGEPDIMAIAYNYIGKIDISHLLDDSEIIVEQEDEESTNVEALKQFINSKQLSVDGISSQMVNVVITQKHVNEPFKNLRTYFYVYYKPEDAYFDLEDKQKKDYQLSMTVEIKKFITEYVELEDNWGSPHKFILFTYVVPKDVDETLDITDDGIILEQEEEESDISKFKKYVCSKIFEINGYKVKIHDDIQVKQIKHDEYIYYRIYYIYTAEATGLDVYDLKIKLENEVMEIFEMFINTEYDFEYVTSCSQSSKIYPTVSEFLLKFGCYGRFADAKIVEQEEEQEEESSNKEKFRTYLTTKKTFDIAGAKINIDKVIFATNSNSIVKLIYIFYTSEDVPNVIKVQEYFDDLASMFIEGHLWVMMFDRNSISEDDLVFPDGRDDLNDINQINEVYEKDEIKDIITKMADYWVKNGGIDFQYIEYFNLYDLVPPHELAEILLELLRTLPDNIKPTIQLDKSLETSYEFFEFANNSELNPCLDFFNDIITNQDYKLPYQLHWSEYMFDKLNEENINLLKKYLKVDTISFETILQYPYLTTELTNDYTFASVSKLKRSLFNKVVKTMQEIFRDCEILYGKRSKVFIIKVPASLLLKSEYYRRWLKEHFEEDIKKQILHKKGLKMIMTIVIENYSSTTIWEQINDGHINIIDCQNFETSVDEEDFNHRASQTIMGGHQYIK